MPVFSVNMKCVFKVYFPFVFIQVFCFVIPAHNFVLLYKEAVLVVLRNPFWRQTSMKGLGACQCIKWVLNLRMIVVYSFSPADEIMFQMEESLVF